MRIEPISDIELNQAHPKQRGQAYGEAAGEGVRAVVGGRTC